MSASHSSHWMPPIEGKVACSIGASLSRHLDARQGKQAPKRKAGIPDRDFFAFRYKLKPPSVDDSKEGVFTRNKVGDNTTINVQLPSSKSNEIHYFSGKEIPAKDVDCILIYDEETGTLVLEKLEACMSLHHERKPPAAPSHPATTSEQRPKPLPSASPAKARPSATKKEEEEASLDEDDVPLKVTVEQAKKSKSSTKPLPKPAAPKLGSSASQPTPKPAATKKSNKRSSAAVEPDTPKPGSSSHAAAAAPKPSKRARISSPALPKPSPAPPPAAVVSEPRSAGLALPGASSSNIYAAPLTADGLPSINTSAPAAPVSVMPPALPPQAEEEEDDDDDWDEVSPPQIVPVPPPPPTLATESSGLSQHWVMEEDLGDSSNAAGGLDDDEFDEALFGAELEQSLMEPDGDGDADADADGEEDEEEDFLMAAVSPVVESASFSGVPMSFHQMAGGDVGGSDDEDTDTSSEDSDDD